MTETTPLGFIILLILSVLLFTLPRRYALIPVLAMACYVPISQAVMVGPFHFYLDRILLIVGWVRILLRGEFRGRGLTSIDKAFLAWALSALVLGSLLWGNVAGLIYRLGHAYDALGIYFLFWALLRQQEDVVRVFKQLALLTPPLAFSMAFEKFTGQNPFYIFGGVAQFDEIRDGVVRSQAVFAHSILAGVFGAALVPYFVALWYSGKRNHWLAALGIVVSTVIAVSAGSSGPIMVYGAAILGIMMWRLRHLMRFARWGIILMLISLQALMKVPVWWAISHISIFSGNTAWYRSNIIDKFITHFDDWWLVGTRSTETWGIVLTKGAFREADITNMFVRIGVDGGLFTLALFLLLIVCCFRGVGRSVRAAALAGQPRSSQFAIWVLGAALFTHVVAFFDVQYFDQNFAMWCLLLAMISCTTKLLAPVRRTVSRESCSIVETAHNPADPGSWVKAPRPTWFPPGLHG